jgi:2'-5' RNA ligase
MTGYFPFITLLAVTIPACYKARSVGIQRMASQATTALIILVPEAEALVKEFRDKYDPSAAEGMPAHVTVLYPFKTLEHIGDDVVAVLHSLFSRHPRFRFSLRALQRFPTALYLAPHPATPFQALTRAVANRYPETPPYGGTFADIVPHLTIAQVSEMHRQDEISDEFHRAAGGKLPIHGYAEQVWLMAEQAGRWRPQRSFALAMLQGP